MKKLLLTIALILALALAVPCMAQTSISADQKITKAEVIPDTAEYVLDTIRILFFTSTCELTYRKIDSTGKSTGKEITIIYMDVIDDKDTLEDETSTEFTDLMSKLGKIAKIVTDETKIKLGISP